MVSHSMENLESKSDRKDNIIKKEREKIKKFNDALCVLSLIA